MECPRRWTVVAITVYLSLQGSEVLCQNVSPERKFMARDNRDCGRFCGNPTSSDLLNSLLNGAFPDLLPTLQGQPAVDNYQRFQFNQEALEKPLSVVPKPPTGCINTQEPSAYFPGPSINPLPSNSNFMVATPLSCGTGSLPNAVPALPEITAPGLPQSNFIPQIAQTTQFDNYPICAQNALRPSPVVLQPQCQFNEANPYSIYNQIIEPMSLPEVKTQPLNLPISPPPQVLPVINTCSGNFEINPNVLSPCLPQSTVLTSEYQQCPLSLQINVPTPAMPPPRVTVVSATPQNTPVTAPAPYSTELPINFPPFQFPSQPPKVLGGCSKSSLRNMLPLLLVALLSDRGGNNDCCCCCNNGNGGNNIPIPYPIPIPTNNPIINSCRYPYSSRNRECRDNGDDDEDKKRK